jgi:hypothetical protein
MAAPPEIVALRLLLFAFSAAVFGACERPGSSSGIGPDTIVARTQMGDSLELTARSILRHDSLLTGVEVRNTAARPQRLEWGACSVSLQLFNADSGAVAVYDSSLRPDLPDSPRVCFAYLVKKTIASGERFAPKEFLWEYPLQCILGDSLAPGTYRGVLTVAFSHSGPISRHIDFDLGAGRLQLQSSRGKLPSNERCS